MDKSKKLLILAHCLERYDIGLFVFFSPILISKFCHPALTNGVLYSTVLFSSAYLVRPLGSMLFGFIGDKYGRKASFLYSIYFMMVATIAIALLPTFSVLGTLATTILFLCRMLQGIASGGEFTSVVLLISENTTDRSLPNNLIFMRIAGLLGVFMSGVIAYIIISFYPDLWRMPFIIGFFITMLNLFLRKNIQESGEFEKEKRGDNLLTFPLKTILQSYKTSLFRSLAIGAFGPALFYTTTVFLPEQIHVMVDKMLLKLYLLLFWICLTYSQYYLVKRIESQNLLYISCIGILVASILFCFIQVDTILASLFVLLSILGSIFFALSPVLYNSLFRTNMRHSGISLGISLGQGTLGGTAPMILAFVYQDLGLPIMATALFATLAVMNIFILEGYSCQDKIRRQTNISCTQA